ncbi:MAG: hypothetical protein IPM95_09925 [Sphingobacteriales bacterium]|nr:hypothetical protein [Sphingobacteriales bacterium]
MSKKKKQTTPKLHKELEGFQISVNQFGEIKSTFPVEKLNEFLNKETADKKLKERKSDKK